MLNNRISVKSIDIEVDEYTMKGVAISEPVTVEITVSLKVYFRRDNGEVGYYTQAIADREGSYYNIVSFDGEGERRTLKLEPIKEREEYE